MNYFVLKLNFEKVREMCISHNWFTKGTNDDYNNFMDLIKFINSANLLNYYNLNLIASRIKEFSDTEESIDEIRQALETIITVSEREVR